MYNCALKECTLICHSDDVYLHINRCMVIHLVKIRNPIEIGFEEEKDFGGDIDTPASFYKP